MIFNWQTNTETRLPNIPNGVRIRYYCDHTPQFDGESDLNFALPSSPFSAGHALLPLTPENNYTPEVIICGGSTVSDMIPPLNLSSQTPASDQCSRIVLTAEGIAAGWQVERMPQPRVMVEMMHLPDGRILLINGAQTGVAGYGNVSILPSLLLNTLKLILPLSRLETKSVDT